MGARRNDKTAEKSAYKRRMEVTYDPFLGENFPLPFFVYPLEILSQAKKAKRYFD